MTTPLPPSAPGPYSPHPPPPPPPVPPFPGEGGKVALDPPSPPPPLPARSVVRPASRVRGGEEACAASAAEPPPFNLLELREEAPDAAAPGPLDVCSGHAIPREHTSRRHPLPPSIRSRPARASSTPAQGERSAPAPSASPLPLPAGNLVVGVVVAVRAAGRAAPAPAAPPHRSLPYRPPAAPSASPRRDDVHHPRLPAVGRRGRGEGCPRAAAAHRHHIHALTKQKRFRVHHAAASSSPAVIGTAAASAADYQDLAHAAPLHAQRSRISEHVDAVEAVDVHFVPSGEDWRLGHEGRFFVSTMM